MFESILFKRNLNFFYQLFFIGISLLIVSLSQPDISKVACIFTAAGGYALFWKGMLYEKKRRSRLWIALVWYFGVQMVHLSWFMADHYVGALIYIFLFFLFAALGLFFGLLCLFIKPPQEMTIWRVIGLSGGWTLFEWSRLFLLSGFSWDPIGLSLSATLPGIQMASAFGLFGLTFFVLFTNLLAFKCFQKPVSLLCIICWGVLATTPYLFGIVTLEFHRQLINKFSGNTLSALLVQTSLYPEQKVALSSHSKSVPPQKQWERILRMLQKHVSKKIDLITFSEAVVPYGTDLPLYRIKHVSKAFEDILGVPLLFEESEDSEVGNAYWAQAIGNFFNADVVIGLEDAEYKGSDDKPFVYNAAFLFSPGLNGRQRYEKRVLVPLGEYIPFQWCKKILTRYGIDGSFTPGTEAKVFRGKTIPIGMSICYEETYGHLMRENRLKGAEILINLTNDVWYPHSRLPMVHYLHGKLRSVESGIPVVRTGNTGVTCTVDSLGRTLDMLPYEDVEQDSVADILYSQIPTYNYPTLYTRYGDQLIIWFSALSVLVSLSAGLLPAPRPVLERIMQIEIFKGRILRK